MNDLIKQKIDAIAECIYRKIEENKEYNTYGLYSGEFGVLLFLHYYSSYSKSERLRLLTDNYSEKLFDNFLIKVESHSFCDGFSGILYLFEILRKNTFIDMDISASRTVIDAYLIRHMRDNIQQGRYDFMHAALGVGLYFVKQGGYTEYLQELIDYLYITAEATADNVFFKWKSLISRKFIGYNLSLSHGIPSIIVFLSRIIDGGGKDTKIIEMLVGSVNYVLSQERYSAQCGSYFPSCLSSNYQGSISMSRLGWCYGDLGIGVALWQAGKSIDNREWKEKGLDILLQSTKRKIPSDTFVVDAGICHGSAGVAMIYRRMYLETMRDEFKIAADFWISQTLILSKFQNGLAGFMTYESNQWKNDYSLLTGISGIGLVLMSYDADDMQSWDDVFLLSNN